MNLIDAFIQGLEKESEKVDLKDILSKDGDLYTWEKFVDIFDCIDIDDVLDGLKKISAKYKLSHDEEITILAYVKFLELMVTKAAMVRGMEMEKPKDTEPSAMLYG